MTTLFITNDLNEVFETLELDPNGDGTYNILVFSYHDDLPYAEETFFPSVSADTATDFGFDLTLLTD